MSEGPIRRLLKEIGKGSLMQHQVAPPTESERLREEMIQNAMERQRKAFSDISYAENVLEALDICKSAYKDMMVLASHALSAEREGRLHLGDYFLVIHAIESSCRGILAVLEGRVRMLMSRDIATFVRREQPSWRFYP